MANFLEDVDFSSHSLHVRFVFNFIFFEYFDRYQFICDCVSPYSHFTESALTKRPTYNF